MKMMVMLAGAGVLALWMSGCAPKLDQTNLSPEEQAWAGYIKQNYKAWNPPQSVPRGVRRADLPDNLQPDASASEAPALNAAAPADESAAPVVGGEDAKTAPETAMTGTPDAEAAPISGDVPPPAIGAGAATAATAAAGGSEETYTVVAGDTLGGIALKFYGRAGAWKKIQDANADVLKGKTVIRTGMKLKIPRP